MNISDSEVIGKIQNRLYEPPEDAEHYEDCPQFYIGCNVCRCDEIKHIEDQIEADNRNKSDQEY